MEIVLLAITIVSLLVALAMSVVAWRASREARDRSAARIAALAAAAATDEPVAQAPPVATTRSAMRMEVPRVEPRPLDIAAETHISRAPWKPHEHVTPAPAAPRQHPAFDTLGDSFLGSAVAAPSSSGRQRGLAVAALVLFFALVTTGYFTIFGDRPAAPANSATPAAAAASSPLELISLRHERRNTRLAITGLVRNPNSGTAVEKLAAVVFLFDQQGGFLASSRADVDYKQLTPGDESPFVINVDAPSNVARYRVSFRTDAGVVPHVDRRGQEPIARDMP